MTEQSVKNYDFLINEEDEVMLLLQALDSEPENPSIELDYENKSAVLYRNQEEDIPLVNISDEVLDALADTDKLLVCELKITTDDSENKIAHAYEADIID